MKLSMFSVFDQAAEAFLPPFFARAKGEAVRMFVDACGDTNRFAKHLQHYALYELATFDDAVGKVVPLEMPVQLMTGFEATGKEYEAAWSE